MLMTRVAFFVTALVFLSACNLTNDPGRRTPGVVIDDAVLENLIERDIRASDQNYRGSHIVIVAYNGIVLIAGQVATDTLRQNASTVAQTLRRVRKVHNELSVGGPTSLLARSNDGWLTTKVKSRLFATENVAATKIKVQTESGIVYLMGLVTRSHADNAVAAAQKVYGVHKIIKVFEYLD